MAQGQGSQTRAGRESRGPTASAPDAPSAGNAASTGAQGVPAINPLTGSVNPQSTGAGEGRLRSGGAPIGG